MRRIHWTEISKNKFVFSLDPEMLTTQGKILVSTCPVLGEPSKAKAIKEIVLDRAYVKEYLLKKVFIPLAGMSKGEIFELLEKVYDSTFALKNSEIDLDSFGAEVIADETL